MATAQVASVHVEGAWFKEIASKCPTVPGCDKAFRMVLKLRCESLAGSSKPLHTKLRSTAIIRLQSLASSHREELDAGTGREGSGSLQFGLPNRDQGLDHFGVNLIAMFRGLQQCIGKCDRFRVLGIAT